MTLMRLCFVVLFGTMSVLHGPIMTFSGAHAAATAAYQDDDHSHHAGHDGGDHDQAPTAKHVQCNAFACFMAVEPLPVAARPLRPVLFAVMVAAPAPALDPVRTAPALPPPRTQG